MWEEANERNKALAGRLAREWVKSRPRALYQPSTPEAFGFAPLTRPELVRLVTVGLAKLFTLMEEAGLDPEKQFAKWSRELHGRRSSAFMSARSESPSNFGMRPITHRAASVTSNSTRIAGTSSAPSGGVPDIRGQKLFID